MRQIAHSRQAVLPLLRPGATHAPHHVPKEWIAKYRGQFDGGWDKLREETLERQKQLGIVPPQHQARAQARGHSRLGQLTADEKKLFARQMEVFAGFGEYADTEIGRLVQAVDDLGQSDNTLIFYIAGDNGASAEGGMNGLFNENSYFNGVRESVAEILKHYDDLGSPMSYGHYAAGWAVAGDTPFTWTKQVASQLRRHPQRHGRLLAQGDPGQGRNCARSSTTSSTLPPRSSKRPGLPEPKVGPRHAANPDRRGEHGLHLCRRRGEEPARHPVLRDLRQSGRLSRRLACRHRPPCALGDALPARRLPTTSGSFTTSRTTSASAHDLAAEKPEKLQEMQTLFTRKRSATTCCRIDDRTSDRFNAAHLRTARPDGRAHVADGLRGDDGHVGKRLHQREEPLAHDHRRGGDSPRGRRRRGSVPGRPVRRMEPVLQGRSPHVHATTGWASTATRIAAASAGSGRQGHPPLSVRL